MAAATTIKVATTQFGLTAVSNPEQFWQRVENLLKEARRGGAELIVFPEYFSLSLMMCEMTKKYKNFRDSLHNSRAHSEKVVEQMSAYSSKHDIVINMGTVPWFEKPQLLNRSFVLFPDGKKFWQDKIFMTRFENEQWHVESGEKKVHMFEWKGHRCAVLTCYDSEFAVLSQTVGRAGVELLLVPSCTDTEHGYWRVRHCCEARAIENQVFVVMSSIVGGDPIYSEIDAHYGRGAIFSPCDTGFPADGVLVQGTPQQEGLSIATLDFEILHKIRNSGAVLNLRDLSSNTDAIQWAKR
ncbi:MAG: carbon-nitrogen hydrolase family protein [Bdellovibrionaceae bacterium]|nr:carbon-nitrogen hydrolase family protein [Pseudobdellovibrionaceae bacterium]